MVGWVCRWCITSRPLLRAGQLCVPCFGLPVLFIKLLKWALKGSIYKDRCQFWWLKQAAANPGCFLRVDLPPCTPPGVESSAVEAGHDRPSCCLRLQVHGSADADVPVADAREFDKIIQVGAFPVLPGRAMLAHGLDLLLCAAMNPAGKE